MQLIQFTDKGLYCPAGDFFIDPWRGVERAIITHAHSDHARWGSRYYLCHHHSKPLLQLRLGAANNIQSIGWKEPVLMNGVKVSLHPAGHIIGSSQIRIEYKGEVWVITGDYKLENDGLSGAWEPVKCHTLLTESTFGLPVYQWQPQAAIYASMQQWVQRNQQEKLSSVLVAYSLGKAQRILQPLSQVSDRIFVHGAIWNTHETLLQAGWNLPTVQRLTPETPKEMLKGAVIIAPPSAEDSPWMRRFAPYSTGVCSGWMQVRGNARRRSVDAGFALSDHCDWPSLLQAVDATGAQKVFVTHGFQSVLSRYLNEKGIESHEVKTAFGTEEDSQENEMDIHPTPDLDTQDLLQAMAPPN
jgi:putative mRNA 3-end processing factor